MVVPPTTEYSIAEESENPSKESVQEEEMNEEDAGAVEEDSNAENDETSDAGKENVYKAQMDLVYQALSEQWSVDKYFENDISSLIANNYEGAALDNVGYALLDFDGDGKDELIISAVSKDASGGMLYDVYSAPNGEVVHVLSGHERNRYYLQYLEGIYAITNEASNSAYSSAWYYYSFVDGKLKLIQGIVMNTEANADNPWFFTYDEDFDVSNDTHDVDGIAESIIETYKRSYTALEYIPFSAYDI